jgi:hypothetical protein
MVKVEVDPRFSGPTLLELEPILNDITDNPVRIGWRGSKAEVRLLESHPNRDFVVCVRSLYDMSIASSLLGTPVQVERSVIIKGRDSLSNKKAYDWKVFSGEIGSSVARSLVVKLAAVRQGLHSKLVGVAIDILQGLVSPSDADVLVRTRGK